MAEKGVIFDRASAELIREVVKLVLAEVRKVLGIPLPFRATPPPMIPVSCQQMGGGAGTSTILCDYNYRILNIKTGAQIAEDVELVGRGQRVVAATMQAATGGIAYKDGDTWYLLWCNETFSQQNCTE